MLGHARARVGERQTVDLRFAEQHLVRSRDVHPQLRFLHLDHRPRTDRGAGPRDAQFQRSAGAGHQSQVERLAGMGVELLNLPLERARRTAVLRLADRAAAGGGVDHVGPRRDPHVGDQVVGRHVAVVVQPHAVGRLAADQNLPRAEDVADDHRRLVGHQHIRVLPLGGDGLPPGQVVGGGLLGGLRAGRRRRGRSDGPC